MLCTGVLYVLFVVGVYVYGRQPCIMCIDTAVILLLLARVTWGIRGALDGPRLSVWCGRSLSGGRAIASISRSCPGARLRGPSNGEQRHQCSTISNRPGEDGRPRGLLCPVWRPSTAGLTEQMLRIKSESGRSFKSLRRRSPFARQVAATRSGRDRGSRSRRRCHPA